MMNRIDISLLILIKYKRKKATLYHVSNKKGDTNMEEIKKY